MEFETPENTRQFLELLGDKNPGAMLIGTEEERRKYGYDRAIVNLAPGGDRHLYNDRWQDVEVSDEDKKLLLPVYDYDLLVEVFSRMFAEGEPPHEDYDPCEAAVEWIDYNVVGGWLGPQTPIISCPGEDEDE